jgi:hypothetical protein
MQIDATKAEKGEDLKKNYKNLLKWVKRFAEVYKHAFVMNIK